MNDFHRTSDLPCLADPLLYTFRVDFGLVQCSPVLQWQPASLNVFLVAREVTPNHLDLAEFIVPQGWSPFRRGVACTSVILQPDDWPEFLDIQIEYDGRELIALLETLHQAGGELNPGNPIFDEIWHGEQPFTLTDDFARKVLTALIADA